MNEKRLDSAQKNSPKKTSEFEGNLLKSMGTLFGALISFAGVLVVWQILSTFLINPKLLPPPVVVAAASWEMIVSGELLDHVAASLQRVLVGFITGSLIGTTIGALMGRVKMVRNLLDPVIELIRPISAVAMIPLAIIWFGIEETSRYFIIFYASIFVVLINTAAGVNATPTIRIQAAKSLGANDRQIFTKIIIPSGLPYILTGMRMALGISFMGVVASEMIAAQSGIGYLIMQSRLLIQTERTFVGLITLGIVGAIIDRIFRVLIARTMSRYMQYYFNV